MWAYVDESMIGIYGVMVYHGDGVLGFLVLRLALAT